MSPAVEQGVGARRAKEEPTLTLCLRAGLVDGTRTQEDQTITLGPSPIEELSIVGEEVDGDTEDDERLRRSRDERKRSELSLLARVRVVQAGLWSAKV